MSEDDLPEPDRCEGAPHPRETARLVGQSAAEAAFLAASASGRVHSGWLLTGPSGIGKATLAYRIAAFLLAGGDRAGGMFGPPETLDLPPGDPDLRQVRAGSHPRLFVLRRTVNADARPPRLRTQIVVEDARDLRRFFGLSATDGGRRVVIVDAADELNTASANAILKLLEEPPAGATLLLVAHQPSRLLPTIRSRCRTLPLAPLSAADLGTALDTALDAALDTTPGGAGIAADAPEALAALAGGSVGAAVRLLRSDGLALYARIVTLLDGLPRLDRTALIALADSAAGRDAQTQFDMIVDLTGLFLSRAARAGLMGAPPVQGAPGEARLLTRLAPHDQAAQVWAALVQTLGARLRQGRAVNLDPAALILDSFLTIEATARTVASR